MINALSRLHARVSQIARTAEKSASIYIHTYIIYIYMLAYMHMYVCDLDLANNELSFTPASRLVTVLTQYLLNSSFLSFFVIPLQRE